VALMTFFVHGLPKLEGGIAFLRNGTPWKVAEAIAAMHVPAPVVMAFVAIGIQFVCSLPLAVGLLTRLNAALIAGTLSVAILQNFLSHRDPQLATLYVLIMVSLIFMGGGRYSLDAWMLSRMEHRTSGGTGSKQQLKYS
jgi:uncharacterized membrane protein YphA (DoxX/SURF4 family)